MREFSSICILLTRKAVILLYILGKPTFKNAKVFSNSNFFAKKRKKKVACNCKREIGSYYSGWVLKLNRHVRSSTDFLLLFYLEMVSLKKSFETILIEKLGWLRSSKELVEGLLQKLSTHGTKLTLCTYSTSLFFLTLCSCVLVHGGSKNFVL